MPEATVHGARLHYERRGPPGAPALLFHHGYMSAGDTWAGVTERLAGDYDCIALDARGCGESERTAGGHSVEQYAADALALASALGVERFTLVGHSMGGAVGMWLALAEPERVERLVLVSSVPAAGVADDEAAAARRDHTVWLRSEASVERLVAERRATAARPRPDAALERAARRWLAASDAHVEGMARAMLGLRLGDRLAELTQPVLVVSAAADGLLPANLADYGRLPNATLHVFSRVSHGVPSEVPDDLAAVIADFMEHGVVSARTLLARLHALEDGAAS
ncbi:MAG: alpha/beta hydrolase [Chloroflexi bacterium]|nr:alpha/beta hydrolase [Chloroflexota bacterium]